MGRRTRMPVLSPRGRNTGIGIPLPMPPISKKTQMKTAANIIVLLFASVVFAAEPITLDSRHQLFLDDYLIASMSGVKRAVEQAQKHPNNPMIWANESWEEKLLTIYGSVIRDGEKYRMWYKSGMGVGYAESDDGIRWTKPALDLYLVDGQKT